VKSGRDRDSALEKNRSFLRPGKGVQKWGVESGSVTFAKSKPSQRRAERKSLKKENLS